MIALELIEMSAFLKQQIERTEREILNFDPVDADALNELVGKLLAFHACQKELNRIMDEANAHARRIREEIEAREERLRAETFPEIVGYLDPN